MGILGVFRYFSTGQSFRSLAFSFRMGHYTAVEIMDQSSAVLWSKLSSQHLAVPDRDTFLDIGLNPYPTNVENRVSS